MLLNALKITFDVISISETKEQSGGFLKNVDLHGYTIYSQHSNSETGGVALYVKSNLDYIIRDDLNVLENEFETIWVEIKNKKKVKMYSAAVHIDTQIHKSINLINNSINIELRKKYQKEINWFSAWVILM